MLMTIFIVFYNMKCQFNFTFASNVGHDFHVCLAFVLGTRGRGGDCLEMGGFSFNYQPGSTNSVVAILARKYSINFISFVHFHHFREYAGNKLKVGVFRIHLIVIRFELWFIFL